jgi:hypothetical protein
MFTFAKDFNNNTFTMKKITFLLLLCSFGLAGFAQQGSLLISTSNNQRFWLFIDDVLQNEYSVPSIRVQGMMPQQYKIHVEMDNVNANCVGQLITISRQNYGDSYVISSRNNTYSINRTQSNVRPVLVQNLIQPNYNYYDYYYQYLYPGFGNPGNYWQGSGNNHGNQYQYYQRPGGGGGHHGGGGGGYNPPPVNPPGHGGGGGGYNPPPVNPPGHGGGGGYGPGSPCRNPGEFSIALSSLNRETFESGKLQFAKDMTVSGPICVEQIIQVCNTFTFETTKLEYAKFAYAYCSDKNLYYLVNNVFEYQSSKDELSRFIR